MEPTVKVSEIGRLASIPRRTVYRWAREHRFGPTVGNPARVPLSAVERFLGYPITPDKLAAARTPLTPDRRRRRHAEPRSS